MNDELTATAGDHLCSFDGRVLEVFGDTVDIGHGPSEAWAAVDRRRPKAGSAVIG